MARPWYDKDPARLSDLRREIELSHPGLRFERRGRSIFVVGEFVLSEGERVVDRYHIKVELDPESERGLPIVREIGQRIPRVAARHMEADGKACVVLPDAFCYEYPEGMSLIDFLNGPLRTYLANQSLIDLGETDVWPEGEWAHGVAGIVEFYAPLLGTDDRTVIIEYLRLLKKETVKGHWPCPCGSGEKLRKCHLSLVQELRSCIPPSIARRSESRFNQTAPPDQERIGPRRERVRL